MYSDDVDVVVVEGEDGVFDGEMERARRLLVT